MLAFLWRATKGYRLRPWKSPYLRWRMETYLGVSADSIGFREFWLLMWRMRGDLRRFIRWAAELRN